jgi:hypothetical protein
VADLEGIMRALFLVWFLVMGFLIGPPIHQAYVDHQIEQADYQADMAEGAQA